MAEKNLDDILAKHDLIGKVHDYFVGIGSTSEQASTAAAAHAAKFVWDGVNLTFQGKPVAQANVPEWFTANHLDFLLPVSNDSTAVVNVDAALLASARSGNKTAQSKVFLAVGKDRAKLDALLAAKSDDTAAAKSNDTAATDEKPTEQEKNNPWSAAHWSITAQGRIYRVDPRLAGRLAAKANSKIGATRPTKAA